jgi:hypothetical protein
MSTNPTPGAGESAPSLPDFDPVPVRFRRDGWTPERQVAFIRALSECGCVRDACRRVGMSPESAYELARRPDAQSFRIAWDVAMDNAVRRVGDGAFSRSIHGVEIPHYYKGELVGTHRRYDERLTMFILRTRDPLRFGRHLEQGTPIGCREDKALDLAEALAWARSDAEKEAEGRPRTVHTDFRAANDDQPARVRDLEDVYAFAPRPDGPAGDEGEHEADEGELGEAQLDEAQLAALEDAAWARVRAIAVARAQSSGDRSEAEIDETIALARSRSEPPDVARTSSTSAASEPLGAVARNCPLPDDPDCPLPGDRHHPQLPPDPRLADESGSATGSP